MLKKISNQPMNMNSREEYRIQRECPFPSPTFTPPQSVYLSSPLHIRIPTFEIAYAFNKHTSNSAPYYSVGLSLLPSTRT